ncbi:Mn superoxide dismutase: [Cyanidioschyzon merolae strain 10D]|jgi:Fe-Mn family superoxide dismutase|uniref:superoxide dismutase n=1 Tax=Cyanidioschyzon merolae (strain NIES-3377 / 10D) TaxID=280699 RepID=M1VM85_CYAM1|nr:Mn superoxide dismutase: [Cyanidioschyzon merolae strain 10D]BAM83058.1 Mn superoxide dismutase: [Cyanidioschyzon merolae strain 10D]|eukprot:XP_005539094.1 Mn superoxide dismutase: [Cyanidioschyzon merolae strain 10D]
MRATFKSTAFLQVYGGGTTPCSNRHRLRRQTWTLGRRRSGYKCASVAALSLTQRTEYSRRELLRAFSLLPATAVFAYTAAMTVQQAAAAVAPSTTGAPATAPKTGAEIPVAPLPYPYNALEPVIDAKTMRLHHDKHFAGYVSKTNAALNEEQRRTFPAILSRLSTISDRALRETVRNQGGGAINHRIFFQTMRAPVADAQKNVPDGALGDAIARQFGSFEAFQKEFSRAAKSLFGSGWIWLFELGNSTRRELRIGTFANQDSPLMQGNLPLLGLDVWEHAYYLRYGPDRGAYVDAWWRVVNWPAVARIFESRQLP